MRLPLFPLRTVLFPGGVLPLKVFEQRYVDMTKACLAEERAFGVVMITQGDEVARPGTSAPTFARIGTTARITDWDMPQLGVLHVIAVGEQRFRILERRVQGDGLTRASIQMIEEDAESTIPETCAGCVKLLERVIEQQAGLFEPPHRLDSASWVSARLTEILPLPLPAKQELLELTDARERIDRLNGLLRAPAERA